ncbi:hypothetical protein WICANDRAFT_83413 [Wickerhamomyces anomalus NRRL Y-366-8]|uniref:Uncharacterized protein n=1 Tax=Wickerhamomyces anomalus (strain ATCC 58044 / CBS 1984 / NCYC 433 / NRRL Y-366-8) TaxID=683960 RepID=A0A1E3P7L4_WICAA|nr:uncharacterized protein WICANDRAFT_83413 [Wickerhamomyces anomalus NRRL Y-366-8]ODQ61214.1 hypothetical protein WICANDRAFT_83413 [Wickerhamomyces anomalus NRRL Y-366-8]
MLFNNSSFKFICIFILSVFHFIQPTLADEETSDVIITTTLTSDSSTIVTTTKSQSPTLVWVTGTNEEGITQTTQSAYTEVFKSFYTSVEVPPKGSIGLGTIKGTVGTLRKYPSLTLNPTPTKRQW